MLTNRPLTHGKTTVGHCLSIHSDAYFIILLLVGLVSVAFPYTYHGCAMAPNSDHGWVVTSDTVLVLHTGDGGISWEQQQILTIRIFYDVFFLDSLSGWTAGILGCIWHTSDGGFTWNLQHLGETYLATRIFFYNSFFGWASAIRTTVLYTTNGGVIWVTKYLYQFPHDSADFYGVSFIDSFKGWMCAGKYPELDTAGISIFTKGQGFIVHSEDGGDSWVLQKRDTIYDFFDVKFKDPLEGWVVGGNDSTMEACVYHTTDGGQTWNRQTLPQSAKILNSLKLIGENKLWAVGRNGTIIHSDDGGISWQMQNSGVDTTLYDVDFADSLRGLIAGDGVVLYTRDGGNTWHEANIVGIVNSTLTKSNRMSITASPNPFSKKITIEFVPAAIPCQLKIYDVTGKLVNSFSVDQRFVWNGLNNQGKEVKPGIFFIELKSVKQNRKLKLVKIA